MSLRQSRKAATVDDRRDVIRVAFGEYLAVASTIDGSQFRVKLEIEQGFRTAHALAGTSDDRYTVGIERLTTLMGTIVNRAAGAP